MIKIESTGLRVLRDELAAMQVNVVKEMRIAAWKAQKRGRAEVAKRLSKIIKQPAKRLKGASYAKMLPNDGGFKFIIREAFKIAIKRFKPKHTKNGVTVKVINAGNRSERRLYRNAFIGGKPGKPSPKLNGNPVERVGKNKYPLRTIPAIGLVAEISVIPGVIGGIGVLLKDEFRKQVRERIRFLKVKLAGKLRNQK
jgi:hypothetical protein